MDSLKLQSRQEQVLCDIQAIFDISMKKAEQKGEEVAEKYNPKGYSSFPFEKITKDVGDLNIFFTEKLEDRMCGVIFYNHKKKAFNIFINKHKKKTKNYFTIAHEIGHYFLHKDIIKNKKAIVDGENVFDPRGGLFSLDGQEKTQIEAEANNFALAMLMPAKFLIKTWSNLKNVEDCADVFNVSVSSMSLRLEKMNLI